MFHTEDDWATPHATGAKAVKSRGRLSNSTWNTKKTRNGVCALEKSTMYRAVASRLPQAAYTSSIAREEMGGRVIIRKTIKSNGVARVTLWPVSHIQVP
jgi:hypothetical protein